MVVEVLNKSCYNDITMAFWCREFIYIPERIYQLWTELLK